MGVIPSGYHGNEADPRSKAITLGENWRVVFFRKSFLASNIKLFRTDLRYVTDKLQKKSKKDWLLNNWQ